MRAALFAVGCMPLLGGGSAISIGDFQAHIRTLYADLAKIAAELVDASAGTMQPLDIPIINAPVRAIVRLNGSHIFQATNAGYTLEDETSTFITRMFVGRGRGIRWVPRPQASLQLEGEPAAALIKVPAEHPAIFEVNAFKHYLFSTLTSGSRLTPGITRPHTTNQPFKSCG